MEDHIRSEVDLGGSPLFNTERVGGLHKSEVDAGHSTNGVLGSTLFCVDVGIAEAENRGLNEAGVDWQAHPCLLLLRSPPIVGFRGAVVTDGVGVSKNKRCVRLWGVALDHGTAEGNANVLDSSLNDPVAIVPVSAAELTFKALRLAVVHLGGCRVDCLTVGFDDGEGPRGVALLEVRLQLYPCG